MPASWTASRTSAITSLCCSCLTDRLMLIVGAALGRQRVPQAASVAATLAQHPAPDRDDQAGLLGERDELPRRDQPALGVAPAQQRLDAEDAAVLEPHERLVVQLELLGGDGALQVGAQLEPGEHTLVHLRLEHRGSCPCRRASRGTSPRRRRGSAPRRPPARPPRRPRCRCCSAARAPCAPTRSGIASDSSTRSAVSAASWTSSMSSSRSANSSPPKRAAVSLARTLVARRFATSASTSSPAAWPRLSLIVLKSSRSRKTTAIPRCSRRLRAIAWRTRSANRARLASPVTGSWKAWCVSCSSKAWRSLTSRQLRTMPPTCSSSTRFVQLTSNCCGVPSRCTSVHCTTCGWSPATEPTSSSISRTRPPSESWTSSANGRPVTSDGRVAEQPLDRRALVGDRRRPAR